MNVAIITTRWNSTRLLGKALKEIDGIPLIQWCIDRVAMADAFPIICTTDNSQPIIDYCVDNNIAYFVGENVEEENLLLRIIQCGDFYEADRVVRVWADNPFLNPRLMQFGLINMGTADYWDFKTWDHGDRFSIYKHKSLTKMYHIMKEEDKWLWNYVDEIKPWQKYGFKVTLYDPHKTFERLLGMNVNTPEDLEAANKIVKKYGREFNVVSIL